MRVLFAGMAALLLLAAPMEKVRAQTQGAAEITNISVSNTGLGREYSGRGVPRPAVTGFAEDINVVVTFSSRVVVTGNPQIVLAIGTQKRYADFEYFTNITAFHVASSACITDTGCRSVHFNYWVQKSDLDTDGIGIAEAGLVLNGGTITSGGKPASLNLAGAVIRIADHRGSTLTVDGRLRQDKVPDEGTIRSLNEPKYDNVFRLGEEILLWVGFYAPVTVTGTPRLKLLFGEGSNGGAEGVYSYDYNYGRRSHPYASTGWIPPGQTTRYAYYDPTLSSPYGLVFSYTVTASDFDSDGYLIPVRDPESPLDLNGGSIVIHGGTARADTSEMSPGLRVVLIILGPLIPRAESTAAVQAGRIRAATRTRTPAVGAVPTPVCG